MLVFDDADGLAKETGRGFGKLGANMNLADTHVAELHWVRDENYENLPWSVIKRKENLYERQ